MYKKAILFLSALVLTFYGFSPQVFANDIVEETEEIETEDVSSSHTHFFDTPVTQTVTDYEEQQIVVSQAWEEAIYEWMPNFICNGCGALFSTEAGISQHSESYALNGDGSHGSYTTTSYRVQTGTILHDAVYSTQRVPVGTHEEIVGYKCSCGATSDSASYSSSLEGYTLSISGEIAVNFYLTLSNTVISKADSCYVIFNKPNGTVTRVYVSDTVKKTQDGKVCYIFPCSVSAKDMTGGIKAVLYYSDGRKLDSYSFSVQDYADYIFKNYGTSTKTYKVTKAMLTYGYYSQKYFGYKLSQLPSGINKVNSVDLKSYVEKVSDSNKNIDFIGARLILASRPGLKLYFSGSAALKLDGKAISLSREGRYQVLTISNITDMSHMYTITADGFSLKYGIFSYGLKNTDNVDLLNLINALYLYNVAINL